MERLAENPEYEEEVSEESSSEEDLNTISEEEHKYEVSPLSLTSESAKEETKSASSPPARRASLPLGGSPSLPSAGAAVRKRSLQKH